MKLFRHRAYPLSVRPSTLRIKNGDLVLFDPKWVDMRGAEEVQKWLRATGRPDCMVALMATDKAGSTDG